MAYQQKPGRGNSNPIMKLSDKLKQGSGLKLLGDLDKDGKLNKYEAKRQSAIDSNSPASMYGAPVHMKGGGSLIGHISGLNYGTPLYNGDEKKKRVDDPNNPDLYTYQSTDVPAGTKRTGRARRRLARSLTEAANQGIDVQGYTTSGTKGKVQIKNKKIKVKTRGKGGAEGAAIEDQTSLNTNVKVKKRDVKKQLKKTGTVTIKDGKVTAGTTQTVTKVGSKKMDARRAELTKERAATRAEAQKKLAGAKKRLAEKKAALEAERTAKRTEAQKKIAERKAAVEAKRAARKK